MPPVVLVLLVLAPFVLVGSLVLRSAVIGRSKAESRREHLASVCFLHRQDAAISPRQWELSFADVRQVAARHGYRELPPPAADVLAFRYDPASATQYAAGQGAGTAVSAKQQRKRDRLAAEVLTREFCWVRPSEVGGTVADVAALAGQHGARMLRSYGSHIDPVLLLGKRSIGSVREVVPAGARKPLTSSHRNSIRIGLMILALVVLVGTSTASANSEWSTTSMVLLVSAIAVLGFTFAPFAFFATIGDTSERMTRLIQEFDGRQTVTLVPTHFRLDRQTYLEVASELGYANSHSHNSERNITQGYEGWITFVPQHTINEQGQQR